MRYRVMNSRSTLMIAAFVEALLCSLLAFFLYTESLRSWKFGAGSMITVALLLGLIVFFAVEAAFGFGEEHITIDEAGLTFEARKAVAAGSALGSRKENYFIPWSEVRYVCLARTASGRYSKLSFIVFSTDVPYPQLYSRSAFDRTHVGIQYRKGLTDVIRRYTDLPIRSIEEIEKV